MRISIRRALAAMLGALVTLPTVAQADWYGSQPVSYSSSYGSYYNQGAEDSKPENNEPLLTPSTTTSWTASPTSAAASTPEACDFGATCDPYGTWRENTILSFGGEAYKSLGDTTLPPGFVSGYMDSAGLVGTVNTGFTLRKGSPIRGQIGGSYGVFDFKGRDSVSFSSAEQQTFLTAGISKRSDILNGDAISWGAVYDQFWAHQWGVGADELYVGQVRGIMGYALNESNEVGTWVAIRTTGDASANGGFLGTTGPLRAMNQYNSYWRHNYRFGGQTMFYIGANDPADVGSWLFGAMGQAPLNDCLGLYSNFVFSLPGSSAGIVGSNEEEWAFAIGLSYFIGGKAVSRSVSGPQGLPLLPVANNGSFLITN